MDSWGDGESAFWIREVNGKFNEVTSSSECQVGGFTNL